jgi:hypothetical protein
MADALVAEVVRPALFYEGQFEGGMVRLWSGIGEISLEGNTWTGGGHMLTISPIGENNELRAEGFEVTLSGMPSSTLSQALANMRSGKTGRLWLAVLDEADDVIGYYELQEGRLDVPHFRTGADGASVITVRYESVLIDLDNARDRRYTHEDLQIDHPGDKGFEFVAKLQDAQIGAVASPVATPALHTNAR